MSTFQTLSAASLIFAFCTLNWLIEARRSYAYSVEPMSIAIVICIILGLSFGASLR